MTSPLPKGTKIPNMPIRSLSGDSERNWEVTLPEVSLPRLLAAPDITSPDWSELALILERSGICFDVIEHLPARQSVLPWLSTTERVTARMTWRTPAAVWQSTLVGSDPQAWRVSVTWMALLTLGFPDPEPFIMEVVNHPPLQRPELEKNLIVVSHVLDPQPPTR